MYCNYNNYAIMSRINPQALIDVKNIGNAKGVPQALLINIKDRGLGLIQKKIQLIAFIYIQRKCLLLIKSHYNKYFILYLTVDFMVDGCLHTSFVKNNKS